MLPDDPKLRFAQYRFLVGRIAAVLTRKYRGLCRYSDLYQWGLVGLYDECCRYRGPEDRFEFCCGVRIRGQIMDELRLASPFPRRMKSEDRPTFVDIADQVLADGALSAEEVIDAREQAVQTVARLSELTPKERTVVELYFWSGMRSVDIARRLALSEPRIHQLRRSALEKMAAAAVFGRRPDFGAVPLP